MVEKSFGFLDSLSSSNAWWQNPGCSFNQVNFCGIFDGTMPNIMTEECDQCRSKFFFLKRKHRCHTCGLLYCSNCSRRLSGSVRTCKKCEVLSQWPIDKEQLSSLRVRDLRFFLNTQGIAADTCTEKNELVDLVIVRLRLQYQKANEGYRSAAPSYSQHNQRDNHDLANDGIRVKPLRVSPAEPSSTLPSADDEAGIRVFPSSQESFPAQDDAYNIPESTNTDTSTSSSWSMLNETNANSQSESISTSENTQESDSPIREDSELPVEPSIPETPEGAEALISAVPENEPPSIVIPPPSKAQQGAIANIVKLSSLTGEDSIKSLSVRQCKEILSLHRVDYSGVWEKHELVSKVMMLWEDYCKNAADVDKLPEDQLCKICMAAPMNCVLLECGHMVSCTLCGKQMAECPICRQNVIRIVRTFRA